MNLIRHLCVLPMLVAMPIAAYAAELIMVEQVGCEWCETWEQEIGTVYQNTPEGRAAPLRRVNIRELPEDLEFIRGLVYTPTFVLVDKGREIGRIQGYPGEDFFWGLLQQLIDRLPQEKNRRANIKKEPLSAPVGKDNTGMRG